MAPTIAAPTSSVSKSAQVTFGLLLIAVAAIAFWEELTDSRLLRVVATPEEATPAQFASLHELWDKYEEGQLEEWDIDMAPGEVRSIAHVPARATLVSRLSAPFSLPRCGCISWRSESLETCSTMTF
jgi:hypothetical protein